ncbi:PaaI family thioesterase [Blattabacterium cuenoti]|uniref:PaaI family thioesterase n=1 Tax=Blattabacterium cuenoti TaxID=1653831 RepID=UPI00163BA8FF|nr:PaaI family thioesterase [Blattabacterium cuenoti]
MKKNIHNLLNELNNLTKNTLISIMNIRFIYLSTKLDILIAKMPINKNILQPFGYLHGGAIMTLSESVGSSISFIINKEKNNNMNIFNIEISANHIRSIKKGFLFSKARIVHKGKTLHIVQINVYNEKRNIISFCKMTNMLIQKK